LENTAGSFGRATLYYPFYSAVESFPQVLREGSKHFSDLIVASALAYFRDLVVDPEKPAKLSKPIRSLKSEHTYAVRTANQRFDNFLS